MSRLCWAESEGEYVVPRRGVHSQLVEVYEQLLHAVCQPLTNVSQADMSDAVRSLWHVLFGQAACHAAGVAAGGARATHPARRVSFLRARPDDRQRLETEHSERAA